VPSGLGGIQPLSGRIGAQIEGVRLAGDLPARVIAAIEAALAKYKVDDADQECFAARFGELVAHPTSAKRAGSVGILELDSTDGRGRAHRWHTDMTFLDAYPKISVLRGVIIPPHGGDTVWANTVAAYDGMPPALKTLAENLWAVHSNLYDYAAARPHASAAAVQRYEEAFISTVLRNRTSGRPRAASNGRAVARTRAFRSPIRRLFAIGLEPRRQLHSGWSLMALR
jgi:alpha-ketoglutarate-dependent sulfate ester dioxygenase